MANPFLDFLKAVSRWFPGYGGGSYRHDRAGGTYPGTPRHWDYTTPIDHRRADPAANSAVGACVLWLARNFPEAPVRVTDPEGEPADNQPLSELCRRPNPYYPGSTLWMACIADYTLTGNAYLRKVRSRAGRVVELWYTPSWTVYPLWPADGSRFLTGYEYRIDGDIAQLPPEDIVHFRFGLDPVTRKGVSPLATALGEVFADDEASRFTAALLRNLGVPGAVVSPKADINLSPEEAEEVKAKYDEKFGGSNRGSVMVMEGPTEVAVLSWSPEQMNLETLRRIPEERISACLGIPAVVVGLGAGLDRATFANFETAQKAAYVNALLPTWRAFADQMDLQLLPDFTADRSLRVEFDTTRVRALTEDENSRTGRIRDLVTNTILTIAEARKILGFEVLPEHEAYLVSNKVTVTPAADLLTPPKPPPAPMPNAPQTPPQPQESPSPPDNAQGQPKATRRLLPPLTPDDIEGIYRERVSRLGVGT